jgi:hypothetical protein
VSAVGRPALRLLLATLLVPLAVGIAPQPAAAFGLNCADPYICFTLTISVSGDGTGTITSDDQHIDCLVTNGQPATTGCTWKYRTLVTTPSVDVDLRSVSAVGSRTCFMSMSDGAVYRSAPVPYFLSCSAYQTDPGSADGDLVPLAISLSADATIGYEFDAERLGLAVFRSGTGTGTVTTKPAGTTFTYGQSVTLTATASAGSVFHGWSGFCSGSNPTCTISITEQLEAVDAKFDLRAASPPPTTRPTVQPTGTRPSANPAQSPPLGSPTASLATGATGPELATVGSDTSPSPTSPAEVAPAAETAPADLAPLGIGIAVAGLLIALAIVGLGLTSRRTRGRSDEGEGP